MQGERAACTIQCLRPGCTYRVRARARNASGYSSYSGAVDAQTSPDRPFAPKPPEATARSASSISVSWEKPQHDGGSEILSYRLELCRGGHAGVVASLVSISLSLPASRHWCVMLML